MCLTSNGWATSGCAGTIFMQKVPKDPGTYSYDYTVDVNGTSYTITYKLDNGTAQTATPYSMN